MPAKRIPSAVKELTGSFDKNPQRRLEDEPIPDGPLGPPPVEFLRDTPETKKKLAAWLEIIDIAAPGVLTKADRIHVRMTAEQMVLCSRESASSADRTLLNKLLGQMGCTPADRTRISVKRAKEADARTTDEWEELANERLSQRAAVQ